MSALAYAPPVAWCADGSESAGVCVWGMDTTAARAGYGYTKGSYGGCYSYADYYNQAEPERGHPGGRTAGRREPGPRDERGARDSRRGSGVLPRPGYGVGDRGVAQAVRVTGLVSP